MVKQINREEAEKEAFAFLGFGCLLTTIQTFVIVMIVLLTDFDWITKWLFIFPILCYIISIITFTIMMIKIDLFKR